MKSEINYSEFASKDGTKYTLKDRLSQGYRYDSYYEDGGIDEIKYFFWKEDGDLFKINRYKRYLFKIIIVDNENKGEVEGYIYNNEKYIIDPVKLFEIMGYTVSPKDDRYNISKNKNEEIFISKYKYNKILLNNVSITDIEKSIDCQTE